MLFRKAEYRDFNEIMAIIKEARFISGSRE